MTNKYQVWMDNNVTESYGTCKEITESMASLFPELTRVRGHYYCLIWGERCHWWLVDNDGVVVDPTADQFPSKGMGVYVPWNEGDPEPTGKCPNCGGHVWDGNTCCSPECCEEYIAFCMGDNNG